MKHLVLALIFLAGIAQADPCPRIQAGSYTCEILKKNGQAIEYSEGAERFLTLSYQDAEQAVAQIKTAFSKRDKGDVSTYLLNEVPRGRTVEPQEDGRYPVDCSIPGTWVVSKALDTDIARMIFKESFKVSSSLDSFEVIYSMVGLQFKPGGEIQPFPGSETYHCRLAK